MSRTVFIGIDGGGGSTECRIAAADGTPLGASTGGSSNIYFSGKENAQQALVDMVQDAGLRPDDIVPCACLGMSGVTPGTANKDFLEIAQAAMPQTKKFLILSDAVIALAGALALRPGICINAGTGSIGIGKNSAGQFAFANGWGPLLGDEGSGYWIGVHGLMAVLRQFDRRGPQTRLSETLLPLFGAQSVFDVPHLVYSESNYRKRVSDLCPGVLDCAAQGDVVALEIIQQAGRELALTARAVAAQLDLLDQPVEVASVGNVLIKAQMLLQVFADALAETLPKAKIILPRHTPAVGALMLALYEVQHEVIVPDFSDLLENRSCKEPMKSD